MSRGPEKLEFKLPPRSEGSTVPAIPERPAQTPTIARQETKPEQAMALCSKGHRVAESPMEAIRQGFEFFSGIYGARFQPAPNALVSWMVVLDGCEAKEISAAILEHSRATVARSDGSYECDWPPTPGVLRKRIFESRVASERLSRPTIVRY